MAYDYDPPDKFGYKDTLPENHPEKVVTGVEFDDEFLKIEAGMTDLKTEIDGLTSAGGIGEAPKDGESYGRNMATWVPVADKAHTHEISNIDGLPDFIADHTHEIADIDDLQDQLDAINNALSGITSNLVFGGSYDLENDIVLRSTKEDQGLLEGQPLPADGVIFDTFMILVSGGTMKGETLARGDWIVADGMGEWIPIPYSIAESIDWGNIQGMPDFDSLYAAKDHTHPEYLEDAPLDGEQYARQSGSWAVVSPVPGSEGPQGPDGPKGDKGDGWTGGSYNASNGIVTFTSDDGLGFVTGDLRGADGGAGPDGPQGEKGDGFTGGSYDAATGIVTFTSDDGLGFSTGDLRGEDGRISDDQIAEWDGHDNYQYWSYQVNGLSTTNVMSQHTINFEAGDNIEITSTGAGISIKGTGGVGWTKNDNGIHYDDGVVGVGTAYPNPASPFTVSDNGDMGFEFRPNEGRILFYNRDINDYAPAVLTCSAFDVVDGGLGVTTLQITDEGDCGIGRPDPQARLDVQGPGNSVVAYIGGSGDVSPRRSLAIAGSDNDLTYTLDSTGDGASGQMAFATNGTERMRIAAGGDVNIGSQTPVAGGRFFDIYNTGTNATDFSILRLITQTAAGGATTSADIAKRKNGKLEINNNETDAGASIDFGIANNFLMRIDSEGRVGIGGTPSRSTKEIEDEAEATLRNWGTKDKKPTKAELIKKLAERTIGGGAAKLQVAGDGYFSGAVSAGDIIIGGTTVRRNGISGIHFGGDSIRPVGTSNATEDAVIDLGATGFRFKDAHFSGTIYGKVADVPDHVKNITPTQIANWDAGTGGGGGGATTDGRISDTQITNWDTAYGWGNHASAGYQPAGSYATTSDLSNYVPKSGNTTISGTLTATDFVASSDERLKDDISPMPIGLIDDIKPVQWTWKDSGKKSAGVIAQQLQEIGLDDFVTEGEDGMLGVNYNALVSVLLAEVISLKKELAK